MAVYVQPLRRRVFRAVGGVIIAVGLLVVVSSVAVGAVFVAFGLILLAVARSHVTTNDEGVLIQNPIRRRFVAWSEIAGVTYGRLPTLRLRHEKSIGLEGVEPFPQAFPTAASKQVLADFMAEVAART